MNLKLEMGGGNIVEAETQRIRLNQPGNRMVSPLKRYQISSIQHHARRSLAFIVGAIGLAVGIGLGFSEEYSNYAIPPMVAGIGGEYRIINFCRAKKGEGFFQI